MNPARLLGMIAAGLVAGFIGLNLLASVVADGIRLDLTENRLYRLSPGTLEVVNRLEEPVTLTFYYSRGAAARYPALRAYGARVRELLRGLAARSGGRIQLSEIDPQPFTQAEDAAIAAGLEAVPTEDGGQLFFGLAGTNTIDGERVIAFFDPANEARLEYEIVRVIAELERARTPVIAIISSLPFAPDQYGRSANPVIDALARTYDVRWLDERFTAIPDADALFLLHPPNLTEQQLYLVDQYTLRRGRVFASVDPLAHLALRTGPDGLPPVNALRTSRLPRLLTAWGIDFDPSYTAMDREHALPVQVSEGGRTRTRAYPLWFGVPPSGLSDALPATAALSQSINLGSPGILAPGANGAARFTPIVSTGTEGARVDSDIAATSPSPDDLQRDYTPDPDGPLVLAARLSGPVSTAFPDGPPEGDITLEASSHLDGPSQAEIIVIADADWLDPAFYTRAGSAGEDQMVADNLALALNLADALAGDPALVSLRSRAGSARPMLRVEALRAEAETRFRELQDELRAELADAEGSLERLSAAGEASTLGGAGSANAARAEALRARIVAARSALRDVERGFRREIDALENRLQFWTLWVPALTVILLAGLATLIRRRRRA
ncbi:MAG: ABC2-type transport system auxiliary protein [Oceanicaulis sp. HLUCCA04]|nr:MAG: ABC2-type transport system auxiliary protein [Oceanicaulis sp. HLUCCA04]